MNFVLALTVGLLVFLVVDMLEEAQEIALDGAGSLDAPVLIPLLASLTLGLLVVVGQRPAQPKHGPASRSLALWPIRSRSASGCTTWARGWPSAPPSRSARPRSASS